MSSRCESPNVLSAMAYATATASCVTGAVSKNLTTTSRSTLTRRLNPGREVVAAHVCGSVAKQYRTTCDYEIEGALNVCHSLWTSMVVIALQYSFRRKSAHRDMILQAFLSRWETLSWRKQLPSFRATQTPCKPKTRSFALCEKCEFEKRLFCFC